MSANYEIIEIWRINETFDEFGRDGNVVGYRKTREQAEMAARGKGWYGGSGNIHLAYGIVIDGKVFPLENKDPVDLDGLAEKDAAEQKLRDEQLRKETIAGLSEDQLRVLNLKP